MPLNMASLHFNPASDQFVVTSQFKSLWDDVTPPPPHLSLCSASPAHVPPPSITAVTFSIGSVARRQDSLLIVL